MSTAKFAVQCPHCEARLKVRNEDLGTKRTCPACKKEFRIPDASQWPEPPPIVDLPKAAFNDLPSPSPTRTRSAKRCPFCQETVLIGAIRCKHCGGNLTRKSDVLAGCLAVFFGPLGLWYKGNWAAGFAWFAAILFFGTVIGLIFWPLIFVIGPIFWFGTVIHAIVATPK